MAGVRWLTVGALALFVGYTRGTDSGYLFDFWSDLVFHTALLSVGRHRVSNKTSERKCDGRNCTRHTRLINHTAMKENLASA